MPQTTTKLPAGPEQTKAGQPRVEIPVTGDQPPPRRRSRSAEADAEREREHHAPVVIDDRAPKLEPWLTVMLVSLVLAALALFVPRPLQPATFAVTGVVMLAGLVMLFVEERRSRRHHHRPAEPRAEPRAEQQVTARAS